jgi:hypothetical protein
VTTTNIANGSYNVTLANAPTGIYGYISIDVSGNGTLYLYTQTYVNGTTSYTPAGTHSGITVTVDGATSEAFTLTVAPKPITETMVADILPQPYTGTQIKPEPTVSYDKFQPVTGLQPVKGADFDYTYGSNTNGGVNAGSVTVTGKGNYTGSVTKTFDIEKVASALVLSSSPVSGEAAYGTNNVTLSATVTGPNGIAGTGEVEFVEVMDEEDQSLGKVTINNGIASLKVTLGLGTHNLKAVHLGDINFIGGASDEITNFNVIKAAQTPPVITNSDLADGGLTKTYGDGPFLLTASGGESTGEYVWSIDDTEVASVDADTGETTIVGAGNTTIRVKKTGDENYKESAETSIVLTVNKKTLTVKLTVADKKYDGTNAASYAVGGEPILVGAVNRDDIKLLAGEPTFTDAAAGNSIPISFTAFSLTGEDVGKYTLTQPSGVTANITKGFTPKKDTHYIIVNSDGAVVYTDTDDENKTDENTGGESSGTNTDDENTDDENTGDENTGDENTDGEGSGNAVPWPWIAVSLLAATGIMAFMFPKVIRKIK